MYFLNLEVKGLNSLLLFEPHASCGVCTVLMLLCFLSAGGLYCAFGVSLVLACSLRGVLAAISGMNASASCSPTITSWNTCSSSECTPRFKHTRILPQPDYTLIYGSFSSHHPKWLLISWIDDGIKAVASVES